jgi:two-component system chemotaxis response regulator CheB
LPVSFPRDGQKIESGHVYVAPPDHHLVLDAHQIYVTRGPKENRFRPSIDVLFRSAARSHGPRVIGVILTGYLDDGASGLYAIKERGGMAVVQSPSDAEIPDMPSNALQLVKVDEIVPLHEMARLLTCLVSESINETGGSAVSEDEMKRMDIEVGIAREDKALERGVLSLGEPSLFTCPECHGVLLNIKEGKWTRFRCHTGHAFSLNSLLAEVTKSIEDSLWSSMRAIEESELLLEHMARHLREAGEDEAHRLVEQKIREARRREHLVRQAVLGHDNLSADKIEKQANDGLTAEP